MSRLSCWGAYPVDWRDSCKNNGRQAGAPGWYPVIRDADYWTSYTAAIHRRLGTLDAARVRIDGSGGRDYRDPEMPRYPFHDRTVCVTRCGRICIGKRKINLSQVFSGQLVGIREVEERIWLVSFLDFDLLR